MIYADIGQRVFSDSSGMNLLPEPDHTRLFYGTVETLRFKLLSGGSALTLNASDTFVLKIDSDFDRATPLMAYSTVFTIVDAVAGIIDVTVNLTSDAFGGKVGTAIFIKAYLRLERYLAGVVTPSVLVQDMIFAFNSIDSIAALPQPDDPEYYNAAQVNAKLAAILEKLDPYGFTTDSETGSTLIFSADALGVDAEACDFEVIQVLATEKKTVTGDAAISRKWTSAGYVVTYAGGWPSGSWQLRAGKIKGDAGHDGDEFDRVNVSGLTLTVQNGPKRYYWTAQSGTFAIDWTAIGNLDKTIQLILTMPSPAVSFAWPSGLHWTGGAAPDMSLPGEYSVAIMKYANGIRANLFDEVFP